MAIAFAVLHVVSAVFVVGPMAILPMIAMRAARGRKGDQVGALAKATRTFSLLSLVVFLLGFAALGTSDPKEKFSFASAWIIWSMVLYVVALAITLAVTVPALRSVAKAVATPADPAELRPVGYGKIAGGSGLATLMLVAVVVLMVWKP